MKDGTPVVGTPGTGRAPKTPGQNGGPRRVPGAPSLRRDLSDDFSSGRVIAVGDHEDEIDGYVRSRRFSGLRFRLLGGIPKSMLGRAAGSLALLACMGGMTLMAWEMRSALMHDPRLVVASSASVQITGNSHLTRPQLLSVFGEDVDRNLLTVPLAQRRTELESLPWVEHATVMRLLPNKIRVAITERKPVAFIRQGGKIGLVDARGVLLDLSPDNPADAHYSFPVVTGIGVDEPASTREARMKLFARFTADLDAGSTGGTAVSSKLSEVDLSSPEDVKALIPNGVNGNSDVLVHFGDDDFQKRYQNFEKNLPGWKAAYPKLASVDMRYEHNVVLEMAAGTAVPVATRPADEVAAAPVKPALVKAPAPKVVAHKPVAHIATAAPHGHLQTAYDVHSKAKAGHR